MSSSIPILFLPILKKNGLLDHVHMTLCNVGSRKNIFIEDDYGSKWWRIFAPNLSIYGFDADADACDAANAELENRGINWKEIHTPLAIGKAIEERTLYVTKAPMCSSLYPPNEPYLKRFAGLPELVNLDFSCEIETTTLDKFCESEEINEINFLQIDVQGADLDVLEGATKILDSVLAIQIEVEFSHLYVDQPLFADIDTFLRKQGFTLFDITKNGRIRSGSPIQSTRGVGQLLWGDAIYFRDPIQSHSQNPDQILKLSCIADILNFPDYALELLEYLTLNYGQDAKYNFADCIIEGLSQFPELVDQRLNSLPIIERLQSFLTNIDISTLQPTQLSQVNQIPSSSPVIPTPLDMFGHNSYVRHNQRRLEHLASLRLNLSNRSVLEVGAGIGDHSGFFLDRGCEMVITEARLDNLDLLRSRYPDLDVRYLDMENPDLSKDELFNIVYCYGLLYHLGAPKDAIEFMSQHSQNILLLETAVLFGSEDTVTIGTDTNLPSDSVSGFACRPTRTWIYNQLKQHFEFVYMPITQPNHEEFPLNWEEYPLNDKTLMRSVFIASRQKLENELLIEGIPMKQLRY